MTDQSKAEQKLREKIEEILNIPRSYWGTQIGERTYENLISHKILAVIQEAGYRLAKGDV